MKNHIEKTILALAIITATPFVLYALNFHGPISDKTSAWADLGSYLSGVFGSIFGFLSVVILLYTLHLTKEYNEKILKSTRHDSIFNDFKWLCELLLNRLETKTLIINNPDSKGKVFTILKNDLSAYSLQHMLGQFDDNAFSSKVFKYAKIRVEKLNLESECILLREIVIKIINENDQNTKDLLTAVFMSMIDKNTRFWIYNYVALNDSELEKILSKLDSFCEIPIIKPTPIF